MSAIPFWQQCPKCHGKDRGCVLCGGTGKVDGMAVGTKVRVEIPESEQGGAEESEFQGHEGRVLCDGVGLIAVWFTHMQKVGFIRRSYCVALGG